MARMNLRFPKFTARNTGLGPNPISGGGNLRGGCGGAPIVFTANLSALAAGQSQALDAGTLQSGFRTPYLIDEIRMQAVTATYSNSGVQYTGLGSYIRAKFQTGQHQFSKNTVPIGLYAPVFSRQDFGSVESGISVRRSYSYVRWPLPKPLWMGPGDVINCTIERDGTLGLDGPLIDINVTYVGRTVAVGTPKPETRQVPWVSWFQNTSAVRQIVSTDEFRNPFTFPMHVQRFTCRTASTVEGVLERLALGQSPANMISSLYATCRLYDSLGYALVKEYAPVGDVFDSARHAWTFARALGPREQYDLTLRTDPTTTAVAAAFTTQVGMVGYRNEVA